MITVYCAWCLRPLLWSARGQRVRRRTETCERVAVWEQKVTPDGTRYWEHNGERRCSIEVLFP